MDDLDAGVLTELCDLLNTISTYPENKKCFDCCDNYSPRYLCTTFSTFVCSCCANIHQEFGHVVKVLSIFSFTLNEITVLKETGNKVAAEKWLARWRADLFSEPDPTSATYKQDARKYLKAKYIEKRWVKLSPPLPIWEDGADLAEGEPRGYDDVSPRKISVMVSAEEPSSFGSQQHEAKVPAQPSITYTRDTYPAPPVVYVPQPMYIMPSMNMPQMTMAVPNVPQYAYPQYHMPPPDAQLGQQPYYGPVYSYPYESVHRLPPLPPPVIQDGVSWPATKSKKKRPVTTAMHPQREFSAQQQFGAAEELPPAPAGAILRSVSDNSIMTTYVLQIPNVKTEAPPTCDCNLPNNVAHTHTKDSTVTKSSTVIKSAAAPEVRNSKSDSKSNSKLKISGIMNKVVGLLGKKS